MATLRFLIAFLLTAPEPLTPQQKRTVGALTIVIALSRLLAVARTMWDWDEALFCEAVRWFDVARHQPHPPGYPLFVLAAKGVHLFISSEFRSLQMISFAGAAALFPTLFFLARELRFRASVAMSGALLFCFFPAVWVYGGTAMSDVSTIAILFVACALLLRGCRAPRSYFWGCIVLSVALGFRPQALLVAAVPLALGALSNARRNRLAVLGGLALCALVVSASYGGAALLAGPREYLDALHDTQQWVHDVDSFHNPDRPSLLRLFPRYFINVVRGDGIGLVVAGLAACGLFFAVRRRRTEALLLVAMFGPAAIFAWLMLDRANVTRYSLSYVAVHAMLAVVALDQIVPRVLQAWRAAGDYGAIAGSMVLAVAFSVWTLPALAILRHTISPPVAALEALRSHAQHKPGYLWVSFLLEPYAIVLMPDLPYSVASDVAHVPESAWRRGAAFAEEGLSLGDGAINERRERWPLHRIVRQRYFDAYVLPLDGAVRYGDGWYIEENDGLWMWRWMQKRGVIRLASGSGPMRLRLELEIPLELVAARPLVDVRLNGQHLDSFRVGQKHFTKTWRVPAVEGQTYELVIETERTINPARDAHIPDDTRDLGLKLFGLQWQKVTGR